MIAIYKYELTGNNEWIMPEGSRILTVQVQEGIPCIWALVNTDKKEKKITYHIFSTGTKINHSIDELKYIGTYQYKEYQEVYHVFANKEDL